MLAYNLALTIYETSFFTRVKSPSVIGSDSLKRILLELIEQDYDFRLLDENDIDELAESLFKHGQLSAIRVRNHPTKTGHFQVIFGNRRVDAARKLGWPAIQADVVEASEEQALTSAIIENIDRKDLSDYEKAIFLERLHTATGKTYSEIAKLIGKSSAFVSLHVSMLHLFPKSTISENERVKVLKSLSEKHARILLKIEDAEDRWNTAKLAVSANLSVRELERFCCRPRAPLARASARVTNSPIQKIISDFTTGFNRKDLRPFFDSFSKKGFTIFASYPPFAKLDNDTAMDYLCESFRRMGEVKETLDDVDIRVSGNFAYITMQVLFEIKHNGQVANSTTRCTIILQNEKEDGWKIVHAHYSTTNPELMARLCFEEPSRSTGASEPKTPFSSI